MMKIYKIKLFIIFKKIKINKQKKNKNQMNMFFKNISRKALQRNIYFKIKNILKKK